VPSLLAEQRRGWRPDDLLCSRNARPRKALVGSVQWGTSQADPPILEETDERAIWQTASHRHGQPTMKT
jgi:hypothetical protein